MDGIAINTSKNAGMEVQNSSVSCDSKKNRSTSFDFIEDNIIINVRELIAKIMTIVWSWKKHKCSIRGEFLFCRLIVFHIGIKLR
jgi:hypothetical protein